MDATTEARSPHAGPVTAITERNNAGGARKWSDGLDGRRWEGTARYPSVRNHVADLPARRAIPFLVNSESPSAC